MFWVCAIFLAIFSPASSEIFQGHFEKDSQLVKSNIEVEKGSLIRIEMRCINAKLGHLTALLTDGASEAVFLSLSTGCTSSSDAVNYNAVRQFSPEHHNSNYTLRVLGQEDAFYEIQLHISKVEVEPGKKVMDTLQHGNPAIFTFTLPQYNETSYRYVDVTVQSNSSDVVGKLIVTPNREELYKFLISPNESTPDALRLSFSTFGRIILSDASKPALSNATWIVAAVLFNSSLNKTIAITIEPNTDYEYVSKIWVLVFVSCFGFILPIFSRYIFNYLNAEKKVTLELWFRVVVNWFYRGNKGLSYLTGFLAWMLLVSAFQVVNAKWREMIDKGDRDVCYYNERCYRPYIGYYDVSVNGIASNMCFMVHGAILIIFVSLSETSCYALKHKNYDYSIAYSFGMAFIFEGFGSLLYHICPSQIIFQFDTLFMFVISQYIIAALIDGNAVRKSIANANFGKAKRKSIRVPKLFLFFLGPAYGFNFLGNLHFIDPLPDAIAGMFFFALAIWVILMLLWAAYKANLLPEAVFSPPRIAFMDDGKEGRVVEVQEAMPRRQLCKLVGFVVYCLVVLIGFILVVRGDLVISIFILGELIIAVIIMTSAAFLGLVKDIWHAITTKKSRVSRKLRCIVPAGIVLYLAAGVGVTAVSLFFFTILEVTNKSLEPWQSRELNAGCILNDFYDSHDLWHFFASHSLLMIILVVVQMSKPCRDCYLKYLVEQHPEQLRDLEGKDEATNPRNKFRSNPEVVAVIPLQGEEDREGEVEREGEGEGQGSIEGEN